jgi:hypothetical protein
MSMIGQMQLSITSLSGYVMSIKIYDVVRIKELRKPVDFQSDGTSVRAPSVGDVAAVIEVYSNPRGYELECSGKDGITIWLWSFAPEDVELEVVA